MIKDFEKFITQTLKNLDWDLIYQIHRIFKIGIGEGSEVIPGLKRKTFSESLTRNDIKNELKLILQFVINNDVPRFVYGNWMIFWFNQNWDTVITDDDLDPDDIEDPRIDSRLEVMYAPQRIALTMDVSLPSANIEKDPEMELLNSMLKNAEKNENYELASKIKDVLELRNKTKNSVDK